MKRSTATYASRIGTPAHTGPWSPGPFHTREEIDALTGVLSGPALPLARGPQATRFRENIADLYSLDADRVVLTSSGTTAVHTALAAAGVGRGDEVIVSPLTDFGSLIGIFQLQAIPVFCDVVPHGLTIDPEDMETRLTKHTKAVIAVHNGGYPADIERIITIARKRKIPVIEDACQSHLARIGKTYVGLFGDFGVFSTNDSKHMKTGEGGFVLCRRKKDARYADLFADKSYNRDNREARWPSMPAINARMSEVNAALGVEQLKNLPSWIEHRIEMGQAAESVLSEYPTVPHPLPKKAVSSYWWVAFSLARPDMDISASEFAAALSAEGIPCRNQTQPYLPGWPLFRKLNRDPNAFHTYCPGGLPKGAYPIAGWPQARRESEEIMAIPINRHTTKNDISDLNHALDKVFSLSNIKP